MIDEFRGDYYFLSNFYPCSIECENLVYPSVEHFYVAMKADEYQYINGAHYTVNEYRKYISNVKYPGLVKKIGNNIKIRKDWNSSKLKIMLWGVREKFHKNPKLSELLLSTGEEILIERNQWGDTFWGVCNDKGKNHLGKILMEVRNELKNGKKTGLNDILNF